MRWTEARDRTVAKWTAIRDSIGLADPYDLLSDVNATCEICDRAEADAGGGLGRCRHCLAYQQLGGCQAFGGRLSDRVAARDWDEVRALVDQAIEALRRLEIPPETEPIGA